jgi:hypothetical protein
VWDPSIITLDHDMVAGSLIGRAGADDPSYRLLGLLPRGGPIFAVARTGNPSS